MGKTYVVGVGMTAFGRHPERSTYDMVNEALDLSLTDAGVDQSSIGAVYYSNATGGYLQGQSMVPGPIAMRRYGIAGVPVYSVENACASGASAFNMASIALEAGVCDVALAVGVEKMVVEDRKKMFGVFDGAWDVSTVDQNKQTLLALGAGVAGDREGAERDAAQRHQAPADAGVEPRARRPAELRRGRPSLRPDAQHEPSAEGRRDFEREARRAARAGGQGAAGADGAQLGGSARQQGARRHVREAKRAAELDAAHFHY